MPKIGKVLRFLRAALEIETDDCIICPFSLSKPYPQVVFDKQMYGANRYICEITHGSAPSPEHHAAHSCGKSRCFNKRHIRWTTPAQNIADKQQHGTVVLGESHHKHKLSESDVRKIRQLLSETVSYSTIARQFNVSKSLICWINKGGGWKWLQ
jgi:hypothetical protein